MIYSDTICYGGLIRRSAVRATIPAGARPLSVITLSPRGRVLAQFPACGHGSIPLVIEPDNIRVLLQSGRMAALGELVGLIFGDAVLSAPIAIFQGLRRPYKGEGVDNFVYAYVSRPRCTYSFKPNQRNERRKPDVLVPPKHSVFVTFVTLQREMVEGAERILSQAGAGARGVVLGWEWTFAAPENPDLPQGHGQRYRRRVWP